MADDFFDDPGRKGSGARRARLLPLAQCVDNPGGFETLCWILDLLGLGQPGDAGEAAAAMRRTAHRILAEIASVRPAQAQALLARLYGIDGVNGRE